MESARETTEEIPKIKIEDYVTTLGLLDEHAARQRNRGYDTITEEFYGELEGWEDDTHKFIHDIVSARLGMKLYTRASMDRTSPTDKRFMNKPEAVEHYEMWILYLGQVAKIYVNTTDRYLAKEIHEVFLQTVMERENLSGAVNWITFKSKFSTMKSPLDSNIPLIDSVPKSERIRAAG